VSDFENYLRPGIKREDNNNRIDNFSGGSGPGRLKNFDKESRRGGKITKRSPEHIKSLLHNING
jgi:hypothetical protein